MIAIYRPFDISATYYAAWLFYDAPIFYGCVIGVKVIIDRMIAVGSLSSEAEEQSLR